MTIGEKIKARRLELGMTTEELGNKIGVQRSAVTKYEKGRVDLKAKQIRLIAEALDMSPAALLPDPDEHSRSLIDEELYELWGGASLQAKRMALTVLKQFREEDNHDLY